MKTLSNYFYNSQKVQTMSDSAVYNILILLATILLNMLFCLCIIIHKAYIIIDRLNKHNSRLRKENDLLINAVVKKINNLKSINLN